MFIFFSFFPNDIYFLKLLLLFIYKIFLFLFMQQKIILIFL